MSKKPIKKIDAHCPRCRSDGRAYVLGEDSYKESVHDDQVTYYVGASLMKCVVCDYYFLRKSLACSEEMDYHALPNGEYETYLPEEITYSPAQAKLIYPHWHKDLEKIHVRLWENLEQIYKAFDNDLNLYAAMGCRSAFERVSIILGINPDKDFKKKLSGLQHQKLITEKEKKVLTVLVEAGHKAVHHNWSPNDNLLRQMISILEKFIYDALLFESGIEKLEDTVNAWTEPSY